MAQTFSRGSNILARLSIIALLLLLAALAASVFGYSRSSYFTKLGYAIEQPVPFSHEHHVGGLGIDCRYCHTAVEESSFAGMPATSVCMNCHSQIWTNAQMLEPVRRSLRENRPLRWHRVNNVPDFVFFNHSIHVQKGMGCVTCHGQVDQMPLMAKGQTLFMRWCLECHREPEKYVRPQEFVFDMRWQGPADPEERLALGRKLVAQYQIQTKGLTDCTTCHR